MPEFLDRAKADGLVEFAGEGRTETITYKPTNHRERWSDPEEQIRAEFWAELIYHYGYAPERIDLEVNVPRRTPNDWADIVVYRDDARKAPFLVFEC